MKELRIKAGRPLLNYVILTAERYSAKELVDIHGGILPAGLENQLKPYQTIVSLSPRLKDSALEVGQLVLINIERYGRSKQKKNTVMETTDEYYDATIEYHVPVIELDGVEHLRLGDNDIEFIIDDYAFQEKKPVIDIPKSNILIPGSKAGISDLN